VNHASQLAHINEAIALCDHVATSEELASAQALLERDPHAPQGDLKLTPTE
jgi:hypothetical protein